jgi:intein/homing endonuclease
VYSQQVTRDQLAAAQAIIDRRPRKTDRFTLTPCPLNRIDALIQHFDDLLDETGQLDRHKRPKGLTDGERHLVERERILCKLDFLYWSSRYAWIKSTLGDTGVSIQRFNPNVAQQADIMIWAEHEEKFWPILMLELKARQNAGKTTLWQIAIAHRVQFYAHVNALMGSSDPEKTRKAADDKIGRVLQSQPWWLLPDDIQYYQSGEIYCKIPSRDTSLTIQHGTQRSGVARGDTVDVFHLTEPAEYNNPEEIIDASLLNTIHENPMTLGCIEGTAKGDTGWLMNKWEVAKRLWPRISKLRPHFTPWWVGTDVWPTRTWLHNHPVPEDWQPDELTRGHAAKAAAYAANDYVLRRLLGEHWTMPREQQWFWEASRIEAEETDTLEKFLEERPGDDTECVASNTKIATNLGITSIQDASVASRCEHGELEQWAHKGQRQTVKLVTELGRQLIATPEHLISTSRGEWKPIGKLSPGDLIALSPPIFADSYYVHKWNWTPASEISIVIDETVGRFLGYFMGDGSFSGDELSVACDAKDVDVIEDCATAIEYIIGRAPHFKRIGGMVRVRCSNVKWFPILDSLDCLTVTRLESGKRAGTLASKRKVHVPACIWKSPSSVIRAFLSALIECDGHAHKDIPRVRFFSKYEEFVRDIQLLLLGFGINSISTASRKIGPNDRVYTGRWLDIGAAFANRFYEQIGFIGKRKSNGKRRTTQRINNSYRTGLVDKVSSVVPHGIVDVYDVGVKDSHCFGANGILVHNCFQSVGYSIFGPQVILKVSGNAKPLALYQHKPAVFAIVGHEIPKAFEPPPSQIDRDRKPIKLVSNLAFNLPSLTFWLYPLHFDGFNQHHEMNRLYVWEMPTRTSDYGIGADLGEGIGRDRSATEVLRKGTMSAPCMQVAEFAADNMNTLEFAPVLFAIGLFYSQRPGPAAFAQPLMAIEGQAGGYATQEQLRKWGWSNFPDWRGARDQRRPRPGNRIGWITTGWNRDEIIARPAKYIKSGDLIVNSPYLISEMKTLKRAEDSRRIEASRGHFDDRWFAFGIGFINLHMDTDLYRGELSTWEQSEQQASLAAEQAAVSLQPDLTSWRILPTPNDAGITGPYDHDLDWPR